ncbi:Tctex-1 [Corynespora cassiicola Philippines]|uniref:Tctex-1 n=1 Tax=Corynespora cassiicola Philippines TaxID=1448308 RepID=A0A2T2NEH4_CORCC|nr:Tctex-1 [Corynespora cassiicola Philippines]
MAAPLPTEDLQQIISKACESALGPAEKYEHASVAEWNTTIINEILKSLIEKTGTGESKTPAFKYIANSTIIQHLGSPSDTANVGRRGMHSAVGAYWNNEKDGTYSYKWEGAEKKGMDIVISITWIGL